MCEYCEKLDNTSLLQDKIDLGQLGKDKNEVYIKRDSLFLYHWLQDIDNEVHAETEAEIRIKYCPICGRKL